MKKILLIEDDVVLRESTAELLELTGDYEIITASNGKVGIEKAFEVLPDVIVCDVMMPNIDGYGVLEELSTSDKTKFIPFIFLSAKTERADVRKGMNLGADDYITKPFSEEELITAIESRIAKSLILNEIRVADDSYEEITYNELKNIDDLKDFFDKNGTLFSYKAKDKVYNEGDSSNHIFLILKGTVKCSKLNMLGKTLTTSLYREGDLFGYTTFSKNQPYQETAIAIEPSSLIGIKKTELFEVLQHNQKLVLDLVDLLTDNLKDVKEQLLDMAYDSVHKKTATTLLKFADKINQTSDNLIKVSRQDLANVAGISTEALIRSISKLKKEGIVDLEGRNIKILNLEALKFIE